MRTQPTFFYFIKCKSCANNLYFQMNVYSYRLSKREVLRGLPKKRVVIHRCALAITLDEIDEIMLNREKNIPNGWGLLQPKKNRSNRCKSDASMPDTLRYMMRFLSQTTSVQQFRAKVCAVAINFFKQMCNVHMQIVESSYSTAASHQKLLLNFVSVYAHVHACLYANECFKWR